MRNDDSLWGFLKPVAEDTQARIDRMRNGRSVKLPVPLELRQFMGALESIQAGEWKAVCSWNPLNTCDWMEKRDE